MKVRCTDPKHDSLPLTRGKIYEVIKIENCGGPLYRIIDDNENSKRYSPYFFGEVSENDNKPV